MARYTWSNSKSFRQLQILALAGVETPPKSEFLRSVFDEVNVGFSVNPQNIIRKMNSKFKIARAASEKQAMAMLYKLEKLTIELAVVGGEIVQLTNAFREKNERGLGQK